MSLRILVIVAVLAFLSVAATAGPSLAAKGGSGKGNHDAALTVEPVAGVAAVDTHDVLVTGSDFRGNKSVLLYVTGSMPVLEDADRDGAFSFVHALEGSGPWTFTAFQYWGNKWHKVAGATYPSQ